MVSLLERITERLRSGRLLFDMALGYSSEEEQPFPPATADQIDAAERALGFALPGLLREIYVQVGNGGFGPGYGLLGVAGGATDDRERTVEQAYAALRRTIPGIPSPWPEQLLPICYLGCGIYDCLDCSKPQGQIYYFEPNIPGDGPAGCVLEPYFGSLEEWLNEWLREDDPFKRVSATVDLGGKAPRSFNHTAMLLDERARRRELGPQGFSIDRLGSRETGRCECCGRTSRFVWGVVSHENGSCAAVYMVHWTMGHVLEHGANFDFILRTREDDAGEPNGLAISFEYRLLESGPAFMVIDAASREIANNELVTQVLGRSDIVDTPISKPIYAMCDAVLAQDERLDELLMDWQIT